MDLTEFIAILIGIVGINFSVGILWERERKNGERHSSSILFLLLSLGLIIASTIKIIFS